MAVHRDWPRAPRAQPPHAGRPAGAGPPVGTRAGRGYRRLCGSHGLRTGRRAGTRTPTAALRCHPAAQPAGIHAGLRPAGHPDAGGRESHARIDPRPGAGEPSPDHSAPGTGRQGGGAGAQRDPRARTDAGPAGQPVPDGPRRHLHRMRGRLGRDAADATRGVSRAAPGRTVPARLCRTGHPGDPRGAEQRRGPRLRIRHDRTGHARPFRGPGGPAERPRSADDRARRQPAFRDGGCAQRGTPLPREPAGQPRRRRVWHRPGGPFHVHQPHRMPPAGLRRPDRGSRAGFPHHDTSQPSGRLALSRAGMSDPRGPGQWRDGGGLGRPFLAPGRRVLPGPGLRLAHARRHRRTDRRGGVVPGHLGAQGDGAGPGRQRGPLPPGPGGRAIRHLGMGSGGRPDPLGCTVLADAGRGPGGGPAAGLRGLAPAPAPGGSPRGRGAGAAPADRGREVLHRVPLSPGGRRLAVDPRPGAGHRVGGRRANRGG